MFQKFCLILIFSIAVYASLFTAASSNTISLSENSVEKFQLKPQQKLIITNSNHSDQYQGLLCTLATNHKGVETQFHYSSSDPITPSWIHKKNYSNDTYLIQSNTPNQILWRIHNFKEKHLLTVTNLNTLHSVFGYCYLTQSGNHKDMLNDSFSKQKFEAFGVAFKYVNHNIKVPITMGKTTVKANKHPSSNTDANIIFAETFITMIIGMFVLTYIFSILIFYYLYRLAITIDTNRRTFKKWVLLLMFIPILNYIIQWYVLPFGLSNSLKQYEQVKINHKRKSLKRIGLSIMFLTLLIPIPIAVLSIILTLFLLILYIIYGVETRRVIITLQSLKKDLKVV